MSENCILIRLLRIYFPRISEFGPASKFRGGGGFEPHNPPSSVRHWNCVTATSAVCTVQFWIPYYNRLKKRIKSFLQHEFHLHVRSTLRNKTAQFLLNGSYACVHTRTSLASDSGWARVPMSQTRPCVECHEPESIHCVCCEIYLSLAPESSSPRRTRESLLSL
jgi:hypothetical protein